MSRYRELFRARIISAIAQARAARGITHKGLKGEIIEILIRDLFRPLLPADIGVASGQIIEKDDRSSRQMDIILYDRSIVPPILFHGELGIIPIESVLYTIEVKSKLTTLGLRKAHEAAKEIHTFSHLSGMRNEEGQEISHKIDHPRMVVFALESNLSKDGKSEAERYRSIYKQDYPHLRAICVAGKEYWWENKGTWTLIPGSDTFRETLGFIGGIANTYKWISKNRGWPNLGNYIIDADHDFVTIPSGTQPTVNVSCDNCGDKAVISFENPVEMIADYPDGFRVTGGCPKCGGDYSAPPGKYQYDAGLLRKVGEIEK